MDAKVAIFLSYAKKEVFFLRIQPQAIVGEL